jgi:hypothetical protein
VASIISGEALEQHLPTDRFRPRPHVVWAGQADATVLLDGNWGLYYTLNEVAGRIWELLVAGEPLIEILHCLQEDYDVATEVLQADLAATLKQWLDSGVIERLPLCAQALLHPPGVRLAV